MIERQLSNHVNTYLVEAEQREAVAIAAQGSALDSQQHAVEALAAASRTKSWWRRLLVVPSADERVAAGLVDHHRQIAIDAGRQIERARIDRAKAEHGQQGEQALPDWFRPRLSDEWRMFHGCYNNKGEIDHLLLGPPGLWAVEVKSDRAKLVVFGDDWELTKLDNGGNIVGRKRAADGRGRNWGRQVSEPAAILATRLARKGHNVPIRTAVVMVTQRAEVVDVVMPGVDLVTASIEEFAKTATTGAPILDHEQLAAIDDLIVEHHRYFEK